MPSPNAALPDMSKILEDTKNWTQEAGQLALKDFENVSPLPNKTDDTLLTPTDLAIENLLISKIQQKYPSHNLVTEESEQRQTGSPFTWVIDPLDGTTAFLQGVPGWGISIALLQDGQPKLGVYYMPLIDDLTWATVENASWRNRPLYRSARTNWGHKSFLAVNTRAHYDFEINLPRIRCLGGVMSSLVYTARGSATAAFIPKAYIGDLAAGMLILKQAGGELRYLSGKPVDLTLLLDRQYTLEPIVAGHPLILDKLGQAIKRR